MTSPSDAVAVAARGEVAWHTEAYAALGVVWRVGHGLAWRVGAGHPFLLAAVTVSPDVDSARVAEATAEATGPVVVRDSHARLDLAPHGYTGAPEDPWMLRPPAPFP